MTPAGSQCMVVSPTNHQPGNPMTIDQAVEKVWPLLTDPTNPMPAWAGLDEIMNLTGCEAQKVFEVACHWVADSWADKRDDRSQNVDVQSALRRLDTSHAEDRRGYCERMFTRSAVLVGQKTEFDRLRDWYASLKRPIEILAEMQKYVPAQETT